MEAGNGSVIVFERGVKVGDARYKKRANLVLWSVHDDTENPQNSVNIRSKQNPKRKPKNKDKTGKTERDDSEIPCSTATTHPSPPLYVPKFLRKHESFQKIGQLLYGK